MTWFARMDSFRNIRKVNRLKTISVLTFWINLSCTSVKGASIPDVPDRVVRHLEAVFEQGNTPTDEDNGYQSGFAEPLLLVKL